MFAYLGCHGLPFHTGRCGLEGGAEVRVSILGSGVPTLNSTICPVPEQGVWSLDHQGYVVVFQTLKSYFTQFLAYVATGDFILGSEFFFSWTYCIVPAKLSRLVCKGSFYIAQYPVHWTARSAFHLVNWYVNGEIENGKSSKRKQSGIRTRPHLIASRVRYSTTGLPRSTIVTNKGLGEGGPKRAP